jgi:hypothetical protein
MQETPVESAVPHPRGRWGAWVSNEVAGLTGSRTAVMIGDLGISLVTTAVSSWATRVPGVSMAARLEGRSSAIGRRQLQVGVGVSGCRAARTSAAVVGIGIPRHGLTTSLKLTRRFPESSCRTHRVIRGVFKRMGKQHSKNRVCQGTPALTVLHW